MTMRRSLWNCALVALMLAGGAAPAQEGPVADDPARERWMAGYLKIEEGLKAEKQRNTVLARDMFREALAEFAEVRRKHPTWNPSLIRYRISFCEERLRRLNAALEADSSQLSREALVSLVAELRAKQKKYEEAVAMARRTISVLKERTATAQTEAEAARALAARAENLPEIEKTLAEMRQDNAQLREAAAQTRDRLAELERYAEENKSLRRRTETLTAENRRLSAAETETGETLAALRTALQTERREAETRREASERQIGVYREQLTEAAEQHRQAAQSLVEAGNRIKQLQDEAARQKTRVQELEETAQRAENRARELARQLETAAIPPPDGADPDDPTPGTGDNAVLLARVTALQNERDDLAEARQDLETRLQNAREEAQAKVAAAEEQLAVLRRHLGDSSEQQQAHSKALIEATDRNRLLRQDLASLKTQLEQTETARVTAAKRARELTAELEQTRTALQESAAADPAVRVARLTEELEDEQRRRMKAQTAYLAAQEQLSRLRDERADSLALLASQTRIRELTDSLQDAQQRLMEMETAVRAAQVTSETRELEEKRLEEQERQLEEDRQARLRRQQEMRRDAMLAEADNNIPKAVQIYRALVQEVPEDHEVLLHLGILLVESGQVEEAETVLWRAFDLDRDDISVCMPLGLALLRQDKPEHALAVFARGAAADPRNADFQRFLGVAARSLGWTVATESAFRRSFQLDQTNGETAYNLAVHFATLEPPRLHEARQWYGTARELEYPADPELEEFLKQAE